MKSTVCCFLLAVCLASTIRAEAARPQSGPRIGVYESEANAAEYRGVHQSPLRAWLQRNHYDFEIIGDRAASDPGILARFAVVVSTSNYIVPDTAGAGLAAFVKAGGRLLWIDGLVDGMSVKPLRRPLALNGRTATRLAAAQAARGRLLRQAFAGLHGDYDAEPRTKDGRVDIDRLFRQIEAAHLDMYDFLIWHAKTDWEDFQIFLAEAQRRRLKVWVTLVPPSEPPASGPFGLDYVRWAEEIGRLSTRYDNLVALVIDDFWSDENRSLFTPSYIARLAETLRGHNPKLAFLPTLYWNTIGDADFIKSYGSLLDGIVFPYADWESTESLPGQLAACRKWLGPDKLLLINVYASGSSGTKEPGPRSPKYLRDILAISRQACDGIRLYCLPKENFDDARFRVVAELFGKWSSQETNVRD